MRIWIKVHFLIAVLIGVPAFGNPGTDNGGAPPAPPPKEESPIPSKGVVESSSVENGATGGSFGIAQIALVTSIALGNIDLKAIAAQLSTATFGETFSMPNMKTLQIVRGAATGIKLTIRGGMRSGIKSSNPTVAPFINSLDRVCTLIINSNGSEAIGPELRVLVRMANAILKSIPPGQSVEDIFGNESVFRAGLALASALSPHLGHTGEDTLQEVADAREKKGSKRLSIVTPKRN